jgi:hypothetical protein
MKVQHQRAAVLAATALLSIAILAWYLRKIKKEENLGGESSDSSSKNKPRSGPASQPEDSGTVGTAASTAATDEKGIHAEIEELDKKGKAFFKEKEVSIYVALLLFGDHPHSGFLCRRHSFWQLQVPESGRCL